MLEKCTQEVYPQTEERAKYYMADSTGVDICGNIICMQYLKVLVKKYNG